MIQRASIAAGQIGRKELAAPTQIRQYRFGRQIAAADRSFHRGRPIRCAVQSPATARPRTAGLLAEAAIARMPGRTENTACGSVTTRPRSSWASRAAGNTSHKSPTTRANGLVVAQLAHSREALMTTW